MGRTYVVTGCASGIGAQLVQQLAQDGHRIIGLDRVEPEGTVDRFLPLDLADPASILAATAAIEEPLDGLCNNAGLPPRDGLAASILQVNFLGQRQLTNALLPSLQEGASVVNMASRAGGRWLEGRAQVLRLGAHSSGADLTEFLDAEGLDPVRSYDLSKEAMILWTFAMTEPLLRRGIRINSISPGGVNTPILDDFARAFGDRMTRNVARAGRPGAPDEIAAVPPSCFRRPLPGSRAPTCLSMAAWEAST